VGALRLFLEKIVRIPWRYYAVAIGMIRPQHDGLRDHSVRSPRLGKGRYRQSLQPEKGHSVP
jgi:hypothetical protein